MLSQLGMVLQVDSDQKGFCAYLDMHMCSLEEEAELQAGNSPCNYH